MIRGGFIPKLLSYLRVYGWNWAYDQIRFIGIAGVVASKARWNIRAVGLQMAIELNQFKLKRLFAVSTAGGDH